MKITAKDTVRTIEVEKFGSLVGVDLRLKGKAIPGGSFNLGNDEARVLGEWLLENAPKPPTNQEVWDEFPIGQRFQFADGNGTKYVKVSAEKFCGPDANFFHDVKRYMHYGFVPLSNEEED